MSNLVPINNRSLARLPRKLSRTLDELSADSRLDIARSEAFAERQEGRAEAVAAVGERAMWHVGRVSQLEQQLATLVPLSTSRLQAIGDLVTLGLGEIVMDTARRAQHDR